MQPTQSGAVAEAPIAEQLATATKNLREALSARSDGVAARAAAEAEQDRLAAELETAKGQTKLTVDDQVTLQKSLESAGQDLIGIINTIIAPLVE